MIMGCTSGAGKSFLVAAICRHLSNRGIRVAPFKAQNMSNHAAVTEDGLEIGRAQYLQAIAARIRPEARMNPVLLKPLSERHSQVIVLGQPNAAVGEIPWLKRKDVLFPVVREALAGLLRDYEQVVIEGAGSPAEINLRESDIVNMSVALECGADVYLVADIDRGGAFAHLFGTWSCLAPEEKALVKGFVLNQFRGDPALLGNAKEWLRERTGIPVVATIPKIDHVLPEEDTFKPRHSAGAGGNRIALIVYPYASNLDEFDPLIHETGVAVDPIRERRSLEDYAAILLPGSRNTEASLTSLRETGLAAEISLAAKRGVRILGICGGMQLLGNTLVDPERIEGAGAFGLGLLNLETTLSPEKITRQKEILWNGKPLRGYEIHHGISKPSEGLKAYLPEDLGWQQGNVFGVYLHGLFENAFFRRHFLEELGWSGSPNAEWSARVEASLEKAARLITDAGWEL